MPITDRDELAAAVVHSSYHTSFRKEPLLAAASGRLTSLWRTDSIPCAASAPAAAATCDNTTPGGIVIPTAASGKQWYIHGISLHHLNATVYLLDRYAQMGGLVGNVTTAQTVNLSLPARVTDYTQVRVYLEVHNPAGNVSVPTVTISYTNQAGVAGRTATLPGGAPSTTLSSALTTLGPFSLQSGDTGLQSVQTCTLSASTTGSGNLGLSLARPVLTLPTQQLAAVGARLTYAETGLPAVGPSPCLWLAAVAPSSGILYGTIDLVEA